ncbi:hypothetical protein Ciccas_013752, partial [Cichlidogyrus casuarinus]
KRRLSVPEIAQQRHCGPMVVRRLNQHDLPQAHSHHLSFTANKWPLRTHHVLLRA